MIEVNNYTEDNLNLRNFEDELLSGINLARNYAKMAKEYLLKLG